jgi:CheY-like chemotaxis protein
VLVVDDEKMVRTVLALGLRSAGFAVWQAAGGREALEVYAENRDQIDVVLLDVRMPEMDGPQTFAALKELNAEVRCCFVSGDPGEYTVEGLLALGAVAYVSKPFSLAEVEKLVRQAAHATGVGVD